MERALPEPLMIKGFLVYKGLLSIDDQQALVQEIRQVAEIAPFYSPITPGGRPMSVRMTAAGRLGWITDRRGYRYEPQHPSGISWPPIPDSVMKIWTALVPNGPSPDCCLINYYGEQARMGLHQDKDEGDFSYPVVSISLGDDGLFRMGEVGRTAKTQSVWLSSGDVVVMGGAARLAWHGIDRIRFGSSSLLSKAGRLNLTLRVVRPV